MYIVWLLYAFKMQGAVYRFEKPSHLSYNRELVGSVRLAIIEKGKRLG